jgi:flagellar motor protein MotB
MIKKIKLGIATCVLLSYSSIAFADGTLETIVFINDDLKTGLKYKNVRYESFGKKGFYFGENYNKKNMSYIKPDNYNWKKERSDGRIQDLLQFENTNNYAFLERIDLKDELSLKKVESSDNEFYMEVYGGNCVEANCLQDENIISIVLPKKFKLISYEAYDRHNKKYAKNENPNIKLIDNTLTMYANDIEGTALAFKIQDISTTSSIYQNVSDSLAKYSEISISKSDTETKISMPMDNVFESGKAAAKPLGKEWLNTLTEALKDKNYKEIRVEGHTDNTPIKGIYPSNWELSSARASDAVRYMIQRGLDGSKIAAVGYAETRPIADNNSKENKAKNRRIEITIIGNADSENQEPQGNLKDKEEQVAVPSNTDTKTQESQPPNIQISEKITNGNQCESLGKKWEWNGTINEWQCL